MSWRYVSLINSRKPENFMMAKENEYSESSLRLIDYGGAKVFKESTLLHVTHSTSDSTAVYLSLDILEEILNRKGTPINCIQQDIWALGVLIESLYLKIYFMQPASQESYSIEEIFTKTAVSERIEKIKSEIERLKIEHFITLSADRKDMIDLLLKIFTLKEDRISLDGILKHPYFEQFNNLKRKASSDEEDETVVSKSRKSRKNSSL